MDLYARHWWQYPKDEAHERVTSVVRKLDDSLGLESTHARLLGTLLNRQYAELRPGKVTFGNDPFELKRRVTLNVVQNILETLTSRICTQRPRPRFITRDGNWKDKRKAQRLDQYVAGVFQRCNVYRETTRAFKDAGWTGTGFIKVCEDPSNPGEILVERVFPLEILVDQQACFQGAPPRTIYQRKWVPSEVLSASFPEQKDAISECDKAGKEFSDAAVIATDLVQVVEAWHLPSAPGVGDGRHVICCEKATLVDDDWPEQFLPFAVLRWTEIPVGFYGQGLVEQQEPLQNELNKIAGRIQDAMHMFATTWVVMPSGAVNKDHLTNKMATIIETEPGFEDKIKVYPPSPISGQVFDYLNWIYDKEHETSAVNQMSASGAKPSGVRAAAALRELRDEQTERFGMFVRAWEHLHLDIAELICLVSKQMYAGDAVQSDYESRYVDRGFYRSIKWSDVDLDRDSYVLQLWPSNLLPSTPAGKLATTEELMAAGLIDSKTAMALLDFPDVEKNQSLVASTVDYVDYAVDRLMDGEDVDTPIIAMLDPPTTVQRLGSHYLRATMEGAPPDKLADLRAFIESVTEQVAEVAEARQALEMAMQQQQAPPPQPGPNPDVSGLDAPPPEVA